MRTDTKHSTSFDTYQVIKRLVAKGIEESQAEEIVHAIIEGRNTDLSQLATKEQFLEMQKEFIEFTNDLKGLRREISDKADKIDIERIRTELEKNKNQLLLMIGASVVATCSIIITFLKFFSH